MTWTMFFNNKYHVYNIYLVFTFDLRLSFYSIIKVVGSDFRMCENKPLEFTIAKQNSN